MDDTARLSDAHSLDERVESIEAAVERCAALLLLIQQDIAGMAATMSGLLFEVVDAPPGASKSTLPADFPFRERLEDLNILNVESLPRTAKGYKVIGFDIEEAADISRYLTKRGQQKAMVN